MKTASNPDAINSLLLSCRSLMGKEKFTPVSEYVSSRNDKILLSSKTIHPSGPSAKEIEKSKKKAEVNQKKIALLINAIKPGCKCERDPDFEATCACGQRIIKRVEKILRRMNKPRILLININGKKMLTVDNKTHSIVDEMLGTKSQSIFKKEASIGVLDQPSRGWPASTIHLNRPTSIKDAMEFANLHNFKSMIEYSQQLRNLPLPNENNKVTSEIESLGQKFSINFDVNEIEAPRLRRMVSSVKEVTTSNQGINIKANHSDTNFDSQKNVLRPSSNEAKLNREKDNLDSINKDVRRTFQSESFFKKAEVQSLLKDILFDLSKEFHAIGYVQGMNFVVAGVIYHCTSRPQAYKVVNFLFNSLELKKVYCFNMFETFVSVLKKLLKCHLYDFFSYFENIVNTDFKMLVLDWFFCLGLNKVPLEYSGILLENIILYGWFYFYRLLVNYLKLFYEAYQKTFVKATQNKQKRLELELELKNYYRSKIDWDGLLKKSMTSPLNDKIIEAELHWTNVSKFHKPGLFYK